MKSYAYTLITILTSIGSFVVSLFVNVLIAVALAGFLSRSPQQMGLAAAGITAAILFVLSAVPVAQAARRTNLPVIPSLFFWGLGCILGAGVHWLAFVPKL